MKLKVPSPPLVFLVTVMVPLAFGSVPPPPPPPTTRPPTGVTGDPVGTSPVAE